MQVTSATTNQSGQSTGNTTSPSTGPADTKTIDYNQYLQLLVAQLQNQDPTNPTDSTQFVSQLASFSSVEQQVQTNAKLDSLLTDQALSQAGAVIGHTVTSADGTISGKVLSVAIKSGSAVATLSNGQTLTLGSGITIS